MELEHISEEMLLHELSERLGRIDLQNKGNLTEKEAKLHAKNYMQMLVGIIKNDKEDFYNRKHWLHALQAYKVSYSPSQKGLIFHFAKEILDDDWRTFLTVQEPDTRSKASKKDEDWES